MGDILYTLQLTVAPDKLKRLTELLGREPGQLYARHLFRDAAMRMNKHARDLEENTDWRVCIGEFRVDVKLTVREDE